MKTEDFFKIPVWTTDAPTHKRVRMTRDVPLVQWIGVFLLDDAHVTPIAKKGSEWTVLQATHGSLYLEPVVGEEERYNDYIINGDAHELDGDRTPWLHFDKSLEHYNIANDDDVDEVKLSDLEIISALEMAT